MCVNYIFMQQDANGIVLGYHSSQETYPYSAHRLIKAEKEKSKSQTIISKQDTIDLGRRDNSTWLVSQKQKEKLVAMTNHMQKIRSTIPDNDRPSIAWLLSYPNSGTSFTMLLVNIHSNRTVASNYPHEPKKIGHVVEPLYNSRFNSSHAPSPPFLLHPNMSLPSKYIMTKTHCAGYCTHCSTSSHFNMSKETFLAGCRSSRNEEFGDYNDESMEGQRPGVVKKAIHLMRDPIDNIVSNYRLEVKKFGRKNQTLLMKHFTNDEEGFFKFCAVADKKWQQRDKQLFGNDFAKLRPVRCHNLFYRWVQWHNLAYEVTEGGGEGASSTSMKHIPTLDLHYEDYGTDFVETKKKLFGFLELESIDVEFHEFVAGKTYRDYFTKKEQAKIFDLIKYFAKPQIWDMTKRYLDS